MIWLVGTMWIALAAALLIGIALGWVLFRAGRRTISQSDWDRVEEERTARQGRIRELDDEVKRLRPVAARVPALEGEKSGLHAAQRRVAELEAESTSLRAAAAATPEFETEAAELRSELTNRAVRIGDLERELAQTKAASTVDLREATDAPSAAVPLAATAVPAAAVATGTVAAVASNGDRADPSASTGHPVSATPTQPGPTPDGASNSLADAESRRQMAARDRRIEQLESRIRRLEAPGGNGTPSVAAAGPTGNGLDADRPAPPSAQHQAFATAPVVSTPATTVAPTTPPTPAPATAPVVRPPAAATAPVVSAPVAPDVSAPVASAPTSPPAPAIATPVQVPAASSSTPSATLAAPPVPPAPARAAAPTTVSTATSAPDSIGFSAAASSSQAVRTPPVPSSIQRGRSSTAAVAGGAGAVAGVSAAAVAGTALTDDASRPEVPTTAPRRSEDVDVQAAERPAPPAHTTPGGRDDLTEIIGIGPKLESMLNELGVTNLRQLADLDDAGVDNLQRRLPDFPGRVRRDDWAGQARRVLASRR